MPDVFFQCLHGALINTSLLTARNKHLAKYILTFPTPTPPGRVHKLEIIIFFYDIVSIMSSTFGQWTNKLPNLLKYLMIEYLSHSPLRCAFPTGNPLKRSMCKKTKKGISTGRHYFFDYRFHSDAFLKTGDWKLLTGLWWISCRHDGLLGWKKRSEVRRKRSDWGMDKKFGF